MDVHQMGSQPAVAAVTLINSRSPSLGQVWNDYITSSGIINKSPEEQIAALGAHLHTKLGLVPGNNELARIATTNTDPAVWVDEFNRYILNTLVSSNISPGGYNAY